MVPKLSISERSEIVQRYKSGEPIDRLASAFAVDRSYPGVLARRSGAALRMDGHSRSASRLAALERSLL